MTASTPGERTSGASAATLQLLTRLAVAFARRRSYPPSHPLVRTAEAQAYEALALVMAERSTLTLSVGKDELLVGEVAVEGSGDVARDFSERLRQRGIGVLTFDRAVSPDSLSQAIGWLAIDPNATTDGKPPVAQPSTPGVTLTRIAYGRLALVDAQASAAHNATSIWRALAAVSMLDDSSDDHGAHVARRDESGRPRNADASAGNLEATAVPEGAPANPSSANSSSTDTAPDDDALASTTPETVAAAIERRISREGYARNVAFVLLRVAEQVAHADVSQRALLGERLRTVLGSLRRDSVGEIIKSVGVGADQRQFISQVIDALPASAIVEWLETAASATDQDLSHHLLSLLGKISARTHHGRILSANESAVRDAARDVVDGWTKDHPPRSAGTALLTQISRFDGVPVAATHEDAESMRMVQIALEIDEFGADARECAQRLIDSADIERLLVLVSEAPGRRAAAELRALVLSPTAVKGVLLRDTLDQSLARALLATVDDEATHALLDVLRDATSRSTRRLVYDRLREFGASLGPYLIPRLDNAPWYVIRNLLALLRDTAITDGAAVEGASTTLLGFLSHQHEQVRVEALRLLVADAGTRDQALRRALDDPNARVVGVAIEALTAEDATRPTTMSPELVRRLLRLIETPMSDAEQLGRIVRVLLDAPPSAAVREQMLALVTRRTLLFRRTVLADVSPALLAAFEVLARHYAEDAKAATVLHLAAAHDDARVRKAAAMSGARPRTAA